MKRPFKWHRSSLRSPLSPQRAKRRPGENRREFHHWFHGDEDLTSGDRSGATGKDAPSNASGQMKELCLTHIPSYSTWALQAKDDQYGAVGDFIQGQTPVSSSGGLSLGGVGVAGAPGRVLEWRSPSPEPCIGCRTAGEVLQAEHPKAIGVSSQEIPAGSRSSPTHRTPFRQGLPERCTGTDIFIPQAEAAEELPHHPALGPPRRLLSPDRSPAGQALGATVRAGGTYSLPPLLQGVYSLCRYRGRSHLSAPSGNTSAIPQVKPSLSFFLFKAM